MLSLLEGHVDKFKHSGQFAGFFSDVFGNPRMVLQTQGEELFLGITMPLQILLNGAKGRMGQTIAGVAGEQDAMIRTATTPLTA